MVSSDSSESQKIWNPRLALSESHASVPPIRRKSAKNNKNSSFIKYILFSAVRNGIMVLQGEGQGR